MAFKPAEKQPSAKEDCTININKPIREQKLKYKTQHTKEPSFSCPQS